MNGPYPHPELAEGTNDNQPLTGSWSVSCDSLLIFSGYHISETCTEKYFKYELMTMSTVKCTILPQKGHVQGHIDALYIGK